MPTATETLYADAVVANSGCVTPENALGAPDEVFTGNTDSTSWDARWSIANPSSPLAVGATHTVTVRARSAPDVFYLGAHTTTISLYSSGVPVKQLYTGVIDSETPQLIERTFTTAEIVDGSGLEVHVQSTGTPPKVPVQIDAIRVDVEVNTNSAPDAPTRTAPADGTTLDRQQPNTFQWQPNDPDPGDSQSAYNFAHRPTGAATWTETGWVASETSEHTAPPLTFPEGGNQWRVQTKDQAGAESEWSDIGFFTAYKAGSGSALLQVSSQATATGTVAYHLEGVGVISVAHSRSASGTKGAAGTGAVEQDSLPVVSSGLRNSTGKAAIPVEAFVGIFSTGGGSFHLALTSDLSVSGTKDTQGEGLLYVTDIPTIDGHKQQWYFAPPTRRVYGHGDRFWRRVYINQGVTVIRKGEAFIVTETPSAEDFEEADRVYVGGYVYPIGDEERLALQAAGYDPFPEELAGLDGDG